MGWVVADFGHNHGWVVAEKCTFRPLPTGGVVALFSHYFTGWQCLKHKTAPTGFLLLTHLISRAYDFRLAQTMQAVPVTRRTF
jgi:hypothetical protein